MLKMLAAAFEDGWAFVKRDDDILLVQPPYLQSNLHTVSEEIVGRAVARHGFVSCDSSFRSWAELIAFLKSRLTETRKDLGLAEPGASVTRGLIEFAPPYILKNYLDRIKDELIPMNEWQASIDLLTVIMGVEAVRANVDLHRYALDVLVSCRQKMQASEIKRRQLVDEESGLSRQFPNTIEKYGVAEVVTVVNNVQKFKSLWA